MFTHSEAIEVLRNLINAGRLVATIDVSGEPFHFAVSVTQRTIGDEIILWLDPTGVDDDLSTVMCDRTDDPAEK